MSHFRQCVIKSAESPTERRKVGPYHLIGSSRFDPVSGFTWVLKFMARFRFIFGDHSGRIMASSGWLPWPKTFRQLVESGCERLLGPTHMSVNCLTIAFTESDF